MTEPTYEYRKGQGWVITTCDSVNVTLQNGKTYRFENRKPVKGEFHSSVYYGNRIFSVNGLGREPDIRKFKTYFEKLNDYEFRNRFQEDTYGDRLWVTVIPL